MTIYVWGVLGNHPMEACRDLESAFRAFSKFCIPPKVTDVVWTMAFVDSDVTDDEAFVRWSTTLDDGTVGYIEPIKLSDK